jgi:probable F420-dependent oxidoreductase
VKFGICLPHYGKSVDLDGLRAVAEDAETMGFDSVWASDHIVTPAHLQPSIGPVFLDAFVVLSHVSALTRRAKLGTTVMVVPYRNPLVAAKIIATLDNLSGGRVVLGVGAGGAPDEFEALGVPESQRGSRTDEYLSVMIELWTNDPSNFEGRFFNFSGVRFGPKPAQQPHPPIWVGGRSDAALRRAVRFGEAWHPTYMTLESLRERIGKLAELSSAAGRESPPEVTIHQIVDFGEGPTSVGRDGERRLGHGNPAQVAADLDSYSGLGVKTVVCNFRSADVPALRSAMQTFAAKVMPQFSGV